jgi:hypothetical protein
MRFGKFIMVAVLAACVATPAFAGNTDRTGTAGAQELRIPVSARGIALGDGFIADVAGVEALYYNPAGIANLRSVEAYFSHLEYIAEMDKNYVGAVARTRFGSIGIMVDALSIGDIIETTEAQPEGTGRVFSPTFTTVGLSYGRFLTDVVSVGVTAKIINERILQETASGFAFDVGIQYAPGWRSLRVGLLLKNFGPDMRFDGDDFQSFESTSDNPQASQRSVSTESARFELPSVFQIGFAYAVYESGQNRVNGYGNFVNNNFGADRWQFGAEYTYGETFALRAGFLASEDEDYIYTNSFSFGVGVGIPLSGMSRLYADYGYRTVDDFFDDTQVFSVKFAF